MAYPVVAIEFFGGVALVLGFQTRLVALATLPVLLGALTVHIGNGWVFNAPNGGWGISRVAGRAVRRGGITGRGWFCVRQARPSGFAQAAGVIGRACGMAGTPQLRNRI